MNRVLRAPSRRLARAVAAIAGVAICVAGCGGSGAMTSGQPSVSSSAAPSGGGTPSGDAAAGIAAAKAATEEAMKEPTAIHVTTPLSRKVDPGKTLVFLQCDYRECASQGQGVKSATEAIGWKFQVIPFKSGDPSTLIAGLKDALRYQPVAVSLSGISEKLWSSVLPDYKKAGVPLIPLSIDDATVDGTVIAVAKGASFSKAFGGVLGNWFIADSDGAGKALIVNISYFPPVDNMAKGIAEPISSRCPGCTQKTLDISLPDLSNNRIPGIVVSELRKDPSIKYVLSAGCGTIFGVVPAIAAAGLRGTVKVGCSGTGPAAAAEVASGQMAVMVGNGFLNEAWLVVDAAARHSIGDPLDLPTLELGAPFQLLTKKDLTGQVDSWDVPKDYQEQFKKLWLVG